MPTLLVLRKSAPPKFHRSIWILHGLSFHQSLEACFAYCVGRILQFTCHKITKLRLSFCKWFVWDVVGGQLPPFSCAYIKGWKRALCLLVALAIIRRLNLETEIPHHIKAGLPFFESQTLTS